MPRFVVLAHDWPFPHLDLFLEHDGVLKAWRLPPDFTPPASATAGATDDHRLHYLEHEGLVPGDRGTVARWDAGELAWEAVEDGRAVVVFRGQRLIGRWKLDRIADGGWRFQPAG